MHVLDPMEVAEVEIWPFWELRHGKEVPAVERAATRAMLHKAEFTVYQTLTQRAQVSHLLNEKVPKATASIDLPPSYRGSIISEDIRERMNHPDERFARRAATIANLAQVVKERDVSLGLRITLVTQAKRLELLAESRLAHVAGETPPEQIAAETQRAGPESDE
jgi:hypothetical protein